LTGSSDPHYAGFERGKLEVFIGMTRNFRNIALVFGVLVLILAIFLVVGSLAGEQEVPVTGDRGEAPGRLFVSSQVLDNGCPVEGSTRFITNQPVYTGFAETEVPSGSVIQTRITQAGELIAQSEEVTVDENMQGSCVTFTFPPDSAQGFPAGDYVAEMYVDGQLADQVQFTIDAGLPDEFEPNLEN
jgi:hypothetical protein